MTDTFPATLTNGVITWGANGAPPQPANEPVEVEVVVATTASMTIEERNRRRKELLLELVRRDVFGAIDDPVEYIRELRIDRRQPGRES